MIASYEIHLIAYQILSWPAKMTGSKLFPLGPKRELLEYKAEKLVSPRLILISDELAFLCDGRVSDAKFGLYCTMISIVFLQSRSTSRKGNALQGYLFRPRLALHVSLRWPFSVKMPVRVQVQVVVIR